MLKLVEPDPHDQKLAILLGHEIAHALMRHSGEKMSMQSIWNIVTAVVATICWTLVGDLWTGALLLKIEKELELMLTTKPYSRKLEREADYIGLLLASSACYDPREGSKLWKRFQERAPTATEEWMSTHPSHSRREQCMRDWLAEAEKLRACAGCLPLVGKLRSTMGVTVPTDEGGSLTPKDGTSKSNAGQKWIMVDASSSLLDAEAPGISITTINDHKWANEERDHA
jgi:hypothetical protein